MVRKLVVAIGVCFLRLRFIISAKLDNYVWTSWAGRLQNLSIFLQNIAVLNCRSFAIREMEWKKRNRRCLGLDCFFSSCFGPPPFFESIILSSHSIRSSFYFVFLADH